MRLHLFSIVIVLSVFCAAVLFADEIVLKDGSVKKGTVILVNEEIVKFTPDNEKYNLEIPRTQVQRITYQNNNSKSVVSKKGSHGDGVDYKKHYPVFGVTFPGTPAGLNLVFGYYSRWVGFHISGGYLGKTIYGGQFNLLFSFYHSRNAIHGLALVGGFMQIHLNGDNSKKWYYGGLAYNMNIYGFFLELGITGGKGDYPNPQAIFQIGYVHRFNKL